jgi:iron complex outermembrane receptor protein
MMSGSAPFIWSNTDAVIKGADVTVNGQLSDTVSLSTVLSIQHGNRDDIDDALFRIAPERLLTTLDWQTAAFTIPTTMSITSELVGRQSYTSSLQNEDSTAGYGLLHVSSQWQLHRNVQVTAQINNLFDKFYAPHTAGVNRVMQSDVALGDKVPNPGREWQISISYQY